MTYNVLMVTLNPTHSLTHSLAPISKSAETEAELRVSCCIDYNNWISPTAGAGSDVRYESIENGLFPGSLSSLTTISQVCVWSAHN